MRPRLATITACVLLGLMPANGTAGPLDAAACAPLVAEVQALEAQGIKQLYEKGPAAAKASASREQLDRIRRYMDLLGQTRFRCQSEQPFITLRPEPAEDPADTAALNAPIEAGAAGVTLPAGAAALVAPVAPRRPAPAAKTAAGAGAAAPAKPPAKAVTAPAAQPAAVKPAAPPAAANKPVPAAAAPSPTTAAPKPAPLPKPATTPTARAKTDDAFRPPTSPPQ